MSPKKTIQSTLMPRILVLFLHPGSRCAPRLHLRGQAAACSSSAVLRHIPPCPQHVQKRTCCDELPGFRMFREACPTGTSAHGMQGALEPTSAFDFPLRREWRPGKTADKYFCLTLEPGI